MFRSVYPKYSNRFPNGEKFSRKTLKKMRIRRRKNNPLYKPVGEEFGRCKYCGNEHEKQARHSYTLNLLETSNICSCCNLVRE